MLCLKEEKMGGDLSLNGFLLEFCGMFGRCEGWFWDLGILRLLGFGDFEAFGDFWGCPSVSNSTPAPQHLQMVVMMLPYVNLVP